MAKLRDPFLDELLAEEPVRAAPPPTAPSPTRDPFLDELLDEGVEAPARQEPGFVARQFGRALNIPGARPALSALGTVGAVLDVPHRALLRAPGHLLGEAFHAIAGPSETVPPRPPQGTQAREAWESVYGAQRQEGVLSKLGGAFGRAWQETEGGLPHAIGVALDPRWQRRNPRAAWWLKYGAGIPLEIAGDIGLGLGLGTVGRVGKAGKALALRVRGMVLPRRLRKALGATARVDDVLRYGKRWARWTIEIPYTRGLVKAGGVLKRSAPISRLRRLFTKANKPVEEALQKPWQAAQDLSAETTYDILREVEPALEAIEALKLSRADRFKASMAAELVKGADEGVGVLRFELDEVLKAAADPAKVRRAAYLIRGAEEAVEKVRLAKGIPTPLLTRPISERAAPLVAKAAKRAAKAVGRRGLRGPRAVAAEVEDVAITPVGRFEAGVQVAGEQAGRRGLQERAGEAVAELIGRQRQSRTRLAEAFIKKRQVGDTLEATIRRREARLAQRLGRAERVVLTKEGARYIKAPSAVAADIYEAGIAPAERLERLIKALGKGGEPLKAAKKDLVRSLGKEPYAQALFEAKTISEMRQRLIRMRRAATSRTEKRGLASLEQSFVDQEARLALRTRAAAGAIPETLERSRGFQRILKRARDLDEAFVSSPSYVARAVPSDLQDAMRQIRQDRVIPLQRAHAVSAAVKERGFMDPATGRAYSMFELNRTLEKAARNPAFLKKNDYIRQLVEELNNEKTIPKLARKLREFLSREKMPLVARVLKADPIQSLALASARATQDGLQHGFIRALKEVGDNAPDVLIRNPEWVPAKALGESVAKRFGKGWYFPPEAKLEMQRIIGNTGKDGAFLRAYDKMLGMWRWSVTQPWPAFHFRNNYSDFILMGYNGVFDPAVVMREGVKAFWKKGTIKVGKLGVMDAADVNRLARAYGVTFGLGRETGATRVGRLGRGIEMAVTGGMTEDARRMGYFVDRLQRGMTPMEAALDTKKVLFDYGALGGFERKVMRRIIPFWSWIRSNVPLQVKTLVTAPYIAASQLRVRRLGQGQPPEWLPKWMRTTTTLMFTESKVVRVISGIGLPVEDLLDVVDMLGNPKGALKEVLSDVERGRLRAPIVQLGVQAARTLTGLGGNLVPAPRGSENLPDSLKRLLGIREVRIKDGTQWVMTERGRRTIDQIRAVGEVTRFVGAKTRGEAALRALTGISRREYTPAELALGSLRERLEKAKETTPFRTFRRDYLPPDVARTPQGRAFRAMQKEVRALGRRVSRERKQREKEERR